jgi:hypothetical protein
MGFLPKQYCVLTFYWIVCVSLQRTGSVLVYIKASVSMVVLHHFSKKSLTFFWNEPTILSSTPTLSVVALASRLFCDHRATSPPWKPLATCSFVMGSGSPRHPLSTRPTLPRLTHPSSGILHPCPSRATPYPRRALTISPSQGTPLAPCVLLAPGSLHQKTLTLQPLPKTGALPSARSTRQSLKNARQRFCRVWHSANNASTKHSLPSTFSRALGKEVCRVPGSTRQRKAAVTATGDGDGVFAECPGWHSAKELPLLSVCPADTRQRTNLCRVPPWTLGKEPPGRVPMSGSLLANIHSRSSIL